MKDDSLSASSLGRVSLRAVAEADLPIFFAHQADPEAARMAAFPPRTWPAFAAHWAKIMAGETNIMRTVLFDGQVAGNVVSFVMEGKREVGYMLGREFWGRGIATQALRLFLQIVTERPLYAHVAKHNLASRRVLEKNGFTLTGEEEHFSTMDGKIIEGYILTLRGSGDFKRPDVPPSDG
jgi:RimJ/RimL family protein N-acetyltransferase